MLPSILIASLKKFLAADYISFKPRVEKNFVYKALDNRFFFFIITCHFKIGEE